MQAAAATRIQAVQRGKTARRDLTAGSGSLELAAGDGPVVGATAEVLAAALAAGAAAELLFRAARVHDGSLLQGWQGLLQTGELSEQLLVEMAGEARQMGLNYQYTNALEQARALGELAAKLEVAAGCEPGVTYELTTETHEESDVGAGLPIAHQVEESPPPAEWDPSGGVSDMSHAEAAAILQAGCVARETRYSVLSAAQEQEQAAMSIQQQVRGRKARQQVGQLRAEQEELARLTPEAREYAESVQQWRSTVESHLSTPTPARVHPNQTRLLTIQPTPVMPLTGPEEWQELLNLENCAPAALIAFLIEAFEAVQTFDAILPEQAPEVVLELLDRAAGPLPDHFCQSIRQNAMRALPSEQPLSISAVVSLLNRPPLSQLLAVGLRTRLPREMLKVKARALQGPMQGQLGFPGRRERELAMEQHAGRVERTEEQWAQGDWQEAEWQAGVDHVIEDVARQAEELETETRATAVEELEWETSLESHTRHDHTSY